MIHPLLEEYVRSETRRQFFRKGANALGWLPSLLSVGNTFSEQTKTMQPVISNGVVTRFASTFRSQSKASDLSAYGRWSFANGHVRL